MAENNILKMKFKLHQMEFELEGNQEVVKEQFENFKSFITKDLLPKINVQTIQQPPIIEENKVKQLTEVQDITILEDTDIPELKEVAMLDLAKTETDWVLLYAFYSTSFGKGTFTIEDIKNSYVQTRRTKKSYQANLSNNMKSLLSKRFIKVHNDTEYLIRPDGVKYAFEILKGNSSNKTTNKISKASKTSSNVKVNTTKSNTSKKSSSNGKAFTLDRNLNLRPEGKESLKEFASKYQTESTSKQIVVIIYYLKEILGLSGVNGDHIHTGLDELNVRIPKSLYQIIVNTKNRDGWIDYVSIEDIGLSVQGRNAIKHDLPKES